MLFYDPMVYQMATITDLLCETIKIIKQITDDFDKHTDINQVSAVIIEKVQNVILANSSTKASTIERYMTFMNEHVFSQLSENNSKEKMCQLAQLIEKLVVLVSDDGLSLEQALVAAQAAQTVVAVAQEELKKPTSFACLLGAGKRILPALKRIATSCHSVTAVSVAAPPAAEAPSAVEASPAADAPPAVDAPSVVEAVPVVEEPQTTEQPQPETEQAPSPPSHEGREAEPTPAASDNIDQKEDASN